MVSPFFLVGLGGMVLAIVVSGTAIVYANALERPQTGSNLFIGAMIIIGISLVSLAAGGVLLYLGYR